jgi:hypothetical protein
MAFFFLTFSPRSSSFSSSSMKGWDFRMAETMVLEVRSRERRSREKL